MNAPARERDVLIVTAAAHFLAHAAMLVFPSLAIVMARDLGLPFRETLGLGFAMYLLYGLGALPAGVLTDLWGRPRLMIAVCLGGMGLCSLAAARAAEPRAVVWSLAGVGAFASLYHPAGMAWISRDVRRRGWGLGVNGVAGNIGVVAAPLTAGLVAAHLGWRTAYVVLAVPALLGAGLALRLGRGAPRTDDRAAGAAGGSRRVAVSFAVLAVAMMLGGLAYRGQTLVLPAWFQERLGSLVGLIEGAGRLPGTGGELVAATTLTSFAYLAGAVGQLVGGRLADRYDLRVVYLVFHGVAAPALLLLGRLDGAALLAVSLVYAFFAFGMQPAENSLVAALTPPRLRSTGYGLKFVMVFGVGSLAVPLVDRWQEGDGLAGVFAPLASVEAAMVGFIVLLAFVSRGLVLRNRP